ncbi:hypothetical protein CDAR_220351 [Caerostris darwini]|uniref:Uncharacterized protein n=1 Tax=Caerostris darwini TaxID=1538125 RepID=A0AAV4UFK9_9ARAC|nr:hypothetical protein CDAR_220351 [Caerostris darwini]
MPIVASRRPVGPCWRRIPSPLGERNPSPRRQPLGYEQHTRTHTLARRSRALSRCFGEKWHREECRKQQAARADSPPYPTPLPPYPPPSDKQ